LILTLDDTHLSKSFPPNYDQQVSLVYGVQAGVGGLGIQSANAVAALEASGRSVHAFGPGHIDRWPLSQISNRVQWHESPSAGPARAVGVLWRRWHPGRQQLERDVGLGRWAVERIKNSHPRSCYVFTQVGLEVLRWAKQNGVPSVLESPNGHIRNFREVYERESARWCGRKFRGHPSPEMVERVEEEYQLADRIRVSSEWARKTMLDRGVLCEKIKVLQQPVDLEHFHPSNNPREINGPLRICFVGSLDLRKGFIYLLRALRLMDPNLVTLEIVGATGTRCCARLFAKERQGLSISAAPADPLPTYHRAEVFVLPTLEDGSPFAVAEAMACGLPVIVTDSCGSAEWVREGHSGWIVPARQPEALAKALEDALRRRQDLKAMGDLARQDTERRAGASCFDAFREWLYQA
jgi:glycosyltransferase involved in cell wall biosynthesis